MTPELLLSDVESITIAHTIPDDELQVWPTLTSNLILTIISEDGQELRIRVSTYHGEGRRDAITVIDNRSIDKNLE